MTAQEIQQFARREILSTLDRRYADRAFSRDLWKRMAEAGLFGYLVPAEYGGSGQGPEALAEAIDAFVLGGQDLGLCLSWLDHLLIHSHVIARFGSGDQKRRHLPPLAAGDRIGALAASEPGTGANPARMRTRAERVSGGYRIRGEKIFITNGPVADFLIVLARTGPGKEGITGFLVDTSTPGFSVREHMDFGFLQTSPHGRLAFEDCFVPEENLIGAPGDGHVRISRAVFGWERAMGFVALSAHFAALFEHVLDIRAHDAAALTPQGRHRLAEAHVTLVGIRDASRQAAGEMLMRTEVDPPRLDRLLHLSHALVGWWERVEPELTELPERESFPLRILIQDARLVQINRRLFDLQMDRLAERLLRHA